MALPERIAVSLLLHGSGALGCLDYGLKYYEYEKRKKRTTSSKRSSKIKFVAALLRLRTKRKERHHISEAK